MITKSQRVVDLVGHYDTMNRAELREALRDGGWDYDRVVIDMHAVEYLDSGAITDLLRARSTVQRHGGELAMRDVPANLARLFQILGLLDAFVILASGTDA